MGMPDNGPKLQDTIFSMSFWLWVSICVRQHFASYTRNPTWRLTFYALNLNNNILFLIFCMSRESLIMDLILCILNFCEKKIEVGHLCVFKIWMHILIWNAFMYPIRVTMFEVAQTWGKIEDETSET
jgi:hypothetical protein